MPTSPQGHTTDTDRLLVYAADPEQEVDRLRHHGSFVEREAMGTLLSIFWLCAAAPSDAAHPALTEVESAARSPLDVVRYRHDLPGYHLAHDQV